MALPAKDHQYVQAVTVFDRAGRFARIVPRPLCLTK